MTTTRHLRKTGFLVLAMLSLPLILNGQPPLPEYFHKCADVTKSLPNEGVLFCDISEDFTECEFDRGLYREDCVPQWEDVTPGKCVPADDTCHVIQSPGTDTFVIAVQLYNFHCDIDTDLLICQCFKDPEPLDERDHEGDLVCNP